MSRPEVRLAVAIAFVVLWCAPLYLDAASSESGGEGGDPGSLFLLLFVYGAATLVTGFVVGWPSIALPFVITLLLIPLGTHPTDSDGWSYAQLYVIPAGFFSFLVLLAMSIVRFGWDRSRASRRSMRPGSGRGGSGRSRWLIPGAVLAVTGLLLGALLLGSTSVDVEMPNLKVENVIDEPPMRSDRALPLVASFEPTCGSTEDEVVDTIVRESETEVVVAARLKVHRDFPCRDLKAERFFDVRLEKPLGGRVVIDDSRGEMRPIYDARTGDRFAALSVDAAKKFLLSKRSGTKVKCFRAADRYFSCSYVRDDTGRRSNVTLTVLPDGRLALGVK